jgi:hypothetical protein
VTTTTTNDQLANLPIPAGATYVYAWADVEFGSPHGISGAVRGSSTGMTAIRTCRSWSTAASTRRMAASPGSSWSRKATLTERLSELTSGHARQLGQALIAAAEEVETINFFD